MGLYTFELMPERESGERGYCPMACPHCQHGSDLLGEAAYRFTDELKETLPLLVDALGVRENYQLSFAGGDYEASIVPELSLSKTPFFVMHLLERFDKGMADRVLPRLSKVKAPGNRESRLLLGFNNSDASQRWADGVEPVSDLIKKMPDFALSQHLQVQRSWNWVPKDYFDGLKSGSDSAECVEAWDDMFGFVCDVLDECFPNAELVPRESESGCFFSDYNVNMSCLIDVVQGGQWSTLGVTQRFIPDTFKFRKEDFLKDQVRVISLFPSYVWLSHSTGNSHLKEFKLSYDDFHALLQERAQSDENLSDFFTAYLRGQFGV